MHEQKLVVGHMKAALLQHGYDASPGDNAFTILDDGNELFHVSIYPAGDVTIEVTDVTDDPNASPVKGE